MYVHVCMDTCLLLYAYVGGQFEGWFKISKFTKNTTLIYMRCFVLFSTTCMPVYSVYAYSHKQV